jgi:hypothetical protein
VEHTDEPAVVVRENGKSRLLYHSGDVERAAWRSGHTDLSRLLQNSWRGSPGAAPVTVDGDGVIECFAWETGPGFALHLLNYTNPNMHRGWLREYYPIGEQQVRMTLPAATQGRGPGRACCARSAGSTFAKRERGRVHRPGRRDYEVAALYAF